MKMADTDFPIWTSDAKENEICKQIDAAGSEPNASDSQKLAVSKYLDTVSKYAGDLLRYMFRHAKDEDHPYCFIRFKEFWGVSKAFCKAGFSRIAEIPVEKVSRGRANELLVVRCCKNICRRKQKRWLMIGTDNIWYYTDSLKEPIDMADNVMVDRSAALRITEINAKKMTIDIHMSRRKILIKLPLYLGLYAYSSLVKALQNSNYSRINRFNSFAPQRMHNDTNLYVDGEGYFKDLNTLLLNAKEEIMICGWFISPEMPMLRPVDKQFKDDLDKDPSTLMALLNKAAYRGVRVYVLVYQEFSMQMYNDSMHCKKKLMAKFPKNIKVLRHPTTIGQSLLWSHHEKMVIIDRKVVMMGGLDIAWGRWDTNRHDLFDFADGCQFPGVDYYNAYKKDFVKGKEYKQSLIPATNKRMPWHDVACRLEGEVVKDFLRHFITYWNNSREINKEKEVLFSQLSLTNPKHSMSESIKKVLRGKIDNESVIKKLIEEKIKKKSSTKQGDRPTLKTMLRPQGDVEPQLEEFITEKDWKQFRRFLSADDSVIIDPKENMMPGQDHFPTHEHQLYGLAEYKLLDLEYLPVKQPWEAHSMENSSRDEQQAGRTTVVDEPKPIDQSGINSGNMTDSPYMHDYHKKPKSTPTTNKFKETLPEELKTLDLEDEFSVPSEHVWSPFVPQSVKPLGNEKDYQIPDEGYIPLAIINSNKAIYDSKQISEGKIEMQALRSASFWSIGVNSIEKSIQNCYLDMIKNAERYIYIENQFFISSTTDVDEHSQGEVANRITKAIFERLKRAIKAKENFKVIIFIPLLPAFEGDLDSDKGGLMQAQIALQRKTMGETENGLYHRLRAFTSSPENYIMFCALRKHQVPPPVETNLRDSKSKASEGQKTSGSSSGVPETELIYIHSKLIIVDDTHLLMGSANLNDRSMQGNRDSELAVYMTGQKNTEVYHNRKLYLVNDKIMDFRLNIFNEHFGLEKSELLFPNSDLFWAKARNILQINTFFYDEVFAVLPSIRYKNWAEVKDRKKEVNLKAYEKFKSFVKGHAVLYPFKFLREENLLKMSLLMELVLPIRALL